MIRHWVSGNFLARIAASLILHIAVGATVCMLAMVHAPLGHGALKAGKRPVQIEFVYGAEGAEAPSSQRPRPMDNTTAVTMVADDDAKQSPLSDTQNKRSSRRPPAAKSVLSTPAALPDASRVEALLDPKIAADRAVVNQQSADSAVVVSNYYQQLEFHLARHHQYPDAGRRQHLSGIVKVALVLQRDGEVVDAWIEASSGQPLLDEAALATIRRATPMPAIPNNLPGTIKFVVPMTFSIRDEAPEA